MADPFVGEIRPFGFNFAPTGWAQCNGQLLPISQNTALFSLLGTNYGGDGKTTFALPNLEGLAPMHFGQGAGLTDRTIGETGGEPTVTLLESEIPAHSHPILGSNRPPDDNDANGKYWAAKGNLYNSGTGSPTPTKVLMAPQMLAPYGFGQPHNNQMPYLVLNYCIAMQGVFPSRS